MDMVQVLVIGYGNTLRCDDGLGWRVANQISREMSAPGVQILALQELTAEIADVTRYAEKVLFVDAAHEGEPGELRCVRVAPSDSPVRYSHHLSPAVVLKLTEELYGKSPPAYLLTVTGETFAIGETLSPPVLKTLPTLLSRIRLFITSNGDVQTEN